MRYQIRWLAALGLVAVAGCATCQPCKAIEPSPQSPRATPQRDDAAPPPPRAPRFDPPPPEDELPPLPVPTQPPAERKKSGKIVRTTRTETEGEATYIEVNAPNASINVNSPGASAPAASAAPQQYPLIPVPVPDSMIAAAARRVGGGLYYAFTGNCPPAKAPRYEMAVPVQAVQYQPVMMQAVPVQAPAPAAAPVPMAAPQAPRKGWWHR